MGALRRVDLLHRMDAMAQAAIEEQAQLRRPVRERRRGAGRAGPDVREVPAGGMHALHAELVTLMMAELHKEHEAL